MFCCNVSLMCARAPCADPRGAIIAPLCAGVAPQCHVQGREELARHASTRCFISYSRSSPYPLPFLFIYSPPLLSSSFLLFLIPPPTLYPTVFSSCLLPLFLLYISPPSYSPFPFVLLSPAIPYPSLLRFYLLPFHFPLPFLPVPPLPLFPFLPPLLLPSSTSVPSPPLPTVWDNAVREKNSVSQNTRNVRLKSLKSSTKRGINRKRKWEKERSVKWEAMV